LYIAGGEMDHFDKIMENISQELLKTLKQMHKTKNPEERALLAQTVHHLTESLSSLMESTATLMSEMADIDMFE